MAFIGGSAAGLAAALPARTPAPVHDRRRRASQRKHPHRHLHGSSVVEGVEPLETTTPSVVRGPRLRRSSPHRSRPSSTPRRRPTSVELDQRSHHHHSSGSCCQPVLSTAPTSTASRRWAAMPSTVRSATATSTATTHRPDRHPPRGLRAALLPRSAPGRPSCSTTLSTSTTPTSTPCGRGMGHGARQMSTSSRCQRPRTRRHFADHAASTPTQSSSSPRSRSAAEPFEPLRPSNSGRPGSARLRRETELTGNSRPQGLAAARDLTDPETTSARSCCNSSRVAPSSASVSLTTTSEPTRPSANEADWDHRYGEDQLWSGSPNGTLVRGDQRPRSGPRARRRRRRGRQTRCRWPSGVEV